MPVQIEEISSTVHAVDDNALLSPAVLRQIIDAVMQQIRNEELHGKRVNAERAVNAGRVGVR